MKTIKLSMAEFRDYLAIEGYDFNKSSKGYPSFAVCDFMGIRFFEHTVEKCESRLRAGSIGKFDHIAKIDWSN